MIRAAILTAPLAAPAAARDLPVPRPGAPASGTGDR